MAYLEEAPESGIHHVAPCNAPTEFGYLRSPTGKTQTFCLYDGPDRHEAWGHIYFDGDETLQFCSEMVGFASENDGTYEVGWRVSDCYSAVALQEVVETR